VEALKEAFNTTPMLYTVEAVAQVYVESEDSPQSFMKALGDRKIVVPVKANVKAGIDMSQVEVSYQDGKYYITLPDPIIELESTEIQYDEMTSYVSGFRDEFSDAEITALASTGREKIIKKLPQMDLVEPAQLNAEQFIRGLATKLGIEVIFDVKHNNSSIDFESIVKK